MLPTVHGGYPSKLVCDANGRVVAFFGGPYHWSYRQHGKTIYQTKASSRWQTRMTVGHIGNVIWIAKIRCPRCRRIFGFTALVLLNRLSRVQRRAFNRLLGLDPKLNLTTLKRVKCALRRYKPGYWARPNPLKKPKT